MFDYYRICTAVPDVKVADVDYNTDQIINILEKAHRQNVDIICFPELCITGYTCGDLFFQDVLLDSCKTAISRIVKASANLNMIIAVGAPCKIENQLFNAAYIIFDGIIHGINIKSFIPNYNEFYEKRWFSYAADLSASEVSATDVATDCEDYKIPVGNDIIYNFCGRLTLGVEICEDMWAPVSPSTWMAVSGAEIILNLSASNDTIGKREYRRNIVKSKSVALMCEYIYTSAGSSESTTDLIFSGHSMIVENGRVLIENKKIADNNYLLVSDIDLGKIRADRIKGKTYKDSYSAYCKNVAIREIHIKDAFLGSDGSIYNVQKYPFIPVNEMKRLSRCNDIFNMQVGGLAKRLSVTDGKMVVGVSGGMDSTLTLLVCAKTLERLGLPMTNLVGITMPAFGTTDRTYNNSLKLMSSLQIDTKIIPIAEACLTHYRDIGHDPKNKDVTFENVQARERTQVLMDYANKIGAIVVGTGDLSELALGWCTYNADQMSMYGVNASIPKTLVKWMIDSVIRHNLFPNSTDVLMDIIDTPISPELLPPDENGNITQKTEDFVGPYELHDFFLYYVVRYGFAPDKIYYMAKKAFKGIYTGDIILKWMNTFYKRFFTQQFKRSCMPDGVKVGSVCLSPRGDWRMPSDASLHMWQKQLAELIANP
ncbi:MAG: NAD(+) synthase [Clostridium sp.]|nr:NAD(+) synthase [Clostridium sp.]MCM1398799.1 NAD(+) synthase [Clostridium sp.]MCM1458569.1 NAD(+) synthase [Bacteroides sp.]